MYYTNIFAFVNVTNILFGTPPFSSLVFLLSPPPKYGQENQNHSKHDQG
jgi:hypothetical protein